MTHYELDSGCDGYAEPTRYFKATELNDAVELASTYIGGLAVITYVDAAYACLTKVDGTERQTVFAWTKTEKVEPNFGSLEPL